jgi:hypothetical protein
MAYTDSEDLNYRGELFLIGAYQTPFLSMMGGLGAGARSNAFAFPLAQPWGLTAASQPAITEAQAAAAGTATTITRAEDTNTCQIFKYDAAVSFMKQAQFGAMSGINTNASNPVTDELSFQKQGQLYQMAIDMEYSFLQGTYQAAANATTAAKTRGIITAATTNTVAAGGAALSKAMIQELMREMAGSGAKFVNPVLFCNAFNKQKISDIYGYAPQDRNVGGLNISKIETDFATVGVVYDPFMPTSTILIADMSVCKPVFVPVRFTGDNLVADAAAGSDVLWVPTAITAAQKGGFFYAQAGIDYGPEEFHGTVTGTAVA